VYRVAEGRQAMDTRTRTPSSGCTTP